MNFNYQKARDLMVENQLRPNKIKDSYILDIFKKKPKEDFLPENLESLIYTDMDITLSHNRGYLKNLHIAQLIKHAEISADHRVLHIGALTGYVTSLLSDLSYEVFAIEEETRHLLNLKDNIKKNQIKNVRVLEKSFRDGHQLEAPFDKIFIDCPINGVNKKLLDQLNDNMGQMIMIEKNNENLSKAFKITKNNQNFSKEYLFDVFSTYELYKDKEEFVF